MWCSVWGVGALSEVYGVPGGVCVVLVGLCGSQAGCVESSHGGSTVHCDSLAF